MKRKNRSLTFSLAFTTIFAIALSILTFGGPWVVEFICEEFHREYLVKFLTVITYLAVPAGWGAIIILFRILINVDKGEIFTESNSKLLTTLSRLCLYVGILCGVATLKFFVFSLISISAFFIGLIVRVVRNIINQASLIKEENDMTV